MRALSRSCGLVFAGAVLLSCGPTTETSRNGEAGEDVVPALPSPRPSSAWSADSAALALADSLKALPAIAQPRAPVGPDVGDILRGARAGRAARERSGEAEASPRCIPNAWRLGPARRGRRPFDFDSIRKLPEAVADSLAAAGALPRLDTLVYETRVLDLDSLAKLPDSTRRRLVAVDSLPLLEQTTRRSGAAPMPVVPFDSAAARMPVHPLPECRRR